MLQGMVLMWMDWTAIENWNYFFSSTILFLLAVRFVKEKILAS